MRLCVLVACASLAGCVNFAPKYKPVQFVVPSTWHGSGPFVEAKPSDDSLRGEWWKQFGDPVLDALEAQVTAANPDLEIAAEHFVQARDDMMIARSAYLPHFALAAGVNGGQRSHNATFVSAAVPIRDYGVSLGVQASWEPDFWSKRRNEARVKTYRAEEMAAGYAAARLSIQAELASDYLELRGYDAQLAIYRQSIVYYKDSLELVRAQFSGALASALDLARAQYLVSNTQSQQANLETRRQVTEHAIAILVNRSPSTFSIPRADVLLNPSFQVPLAVPSALLERRPDVAEAERQMAQASTEIGIARAAFYPNVSLSGTIGLEAPIQMLFQLASAAWSLGASAVQPIFEGGYHRAQLQQAWSGYRETQDHYRSVVLNAFREVEDDLSRTTQLTSAVKDQSDAMDAAEKQQTLSMQLFAGGLASSLDVITSQVYALESKLAVVELRAQLLVAQVGLIRGLGGGWDRARLPADKDIQPFGTFAVHKLAKPRPAGGIDVETEHREHLEDLTRPITTPSPDR